MHMFFIFIYYYTYLLYYIIIILYLFITILLYTYLNVIDTIAILSLPRQRNFKEELTYNAHDIISQNETCLVNIGILLQA